MPSPTSTVEEVLAFVAKELRVEYGRVTLHFDAGKLVMITPEPRLKPWDLTVLLTRRFDVDLHPRGRAP